MRQDVLLKSNKADALYLDLLADETFNELSAYPQRLEKWIQEGDYQQIIIDEVQKLPKILDEVHRLIEKTKG